MPFPALIYVETLTCAADSTGYDSPTLIREPEPRDISVIFGSASGSSPTRDEAAKRWHRDLGLAPNQRVAFVQTDRVILNRIYKVRAQALAQNQELSFVDAWRLVKSRLRKKRR